jgi:hypothetical protein
MALRFPLQYVPGDSAKPGSEWLGLSISGSVSIRFRKRFLNQVFSHASVAAGCKQESQQPAMVLLNRGSGPKCIGFAATVSPGRHHKSFPSDILSGEMGRD